MSSSDNPVSITTELAPVKRGHFEFKPEPNIYRDEDGELEVVAGDHGVTISVTQERGVDSYNSFFTCETLLPRPEAERLRDWLIEVLS